MRLPALVIGASILLAPAGAEAQRGSPRDAVISFGREYDTGDGYANARVTVRYQFADCAGDVAVLYAMDRSSVWTASTYYYRGKSYEVPSSMGAPRPETVVFQGPVLDEVGRFQGSFSDPYTQGGAGAGCLGQSKVVFSRKSKLGEGSTAAQYEQFLQTLWIRPTTQPRMRDGRVESWIGEQLAKQRDDSLQQVADRNKRERDAKARRDSIDREQRLADDRRRRTDDSTRAERERVADDDRTREEADDRTREQDQAERDREQERTNRANVDAQTERLNAMWAVEKLQWERAEAAMARGDVATARPLYEELAGSLVYGDQAKARLAALNEQQLAQGIMGVFSLIGMIDSKLDGTGFFIGPSYGPTGFPGDKGAAGFSAGFAMTPQQRWVPYVDLLLFSLGSDDALAQRYMPSKTLTAAAVGTTTPWLKLRLGQNATLAPHFGYRAIGTDLRWVNVGQTGLMLLTRGMLIRGDVVMINGKPQYNGALARVF